MPATLPASSPVRSGASPRPAAPPSAAGALPGRPPEPLPGAPEPPDLEVVTSDREEPPLPDEARAAVVASAAAPTQPREAGPGGRLQVGFSAGLAADELQAAMAAVRDILRARPGTTRVTVLLPQGAGRPALPMELRMGVAYDAELAAEIDRRLGPGRVRLDLGHEPQVSPG